MEDFTSPARDSGCVVVCHGGSLASLKYFESLSCTDDSPYSYSKILELAGRHFSNEFRVSNLFHPIGFNHNLHIITHN